MSHSVYEIRDEEGFSDGVVRAVADHSARPPEALPPLFEAVDPEALDSVFSSSTRTPARGDARVEFQYASYRVVVESYGIIKLRPPEKERERG